MAKGSEGERKEISNRILFLVSPRPKCSEVSNYSVAECLMLWSVNPAYSVSD
jgi:hypothetical protein